MSRDERKVEAFLETVVARGETGLLNLQDSIEPEISKPDRVLELLANLSGEPAATGLDAQLELAELIGQGGMGQVHLATQRSMGRKVAVKSVRPDRRDPAALAGLVREAWVTGSLEHPNIVPVHNVGISASGDPLVVLKRIEGVEWSELLAADEVVARRFGSTDLLDWNLAILLQVANAVRFAHSRGVIHRDLKPQNVMIGEFGEVYLVDWGIAVSTRADRDGRLPAPSESSQPAGTPGYMAPEMLDGGAATPQTDIYLLGAILFQLVEGRMPHQASSHREVVDSIRSSPPPLSDACPIELREICTKAMAREPERRYRDVADMQLAIREFRAHRTSRRLTEGALARLDSLESKVASARRAPEDLAELYNLFSECRFGFREAQSSWPGNPQAAEGLNRALRLMIDLEIDQDEPRSARNLVSQLAEPDPELTRRVDAALASKQARLEKLDALGQQHNLQTGWLTRTVTLGIFGLVWALGTLLVASFAPNLLSSPSDLAWFSFVMIFMIGGVGYWARESLMKTVVNRRLLITALFVGPAQLALIGGGSLLELTMPQLMSSMLFLWFVLAGMITITTTRKFVPMLLGYLAGFFLSTQAPDQVMLLMGLSNLVMLVNVGYCSIRARSGDYEL